MSLESLSVLESKVVSMIEIVTSLRQERQNLLEQNSLLQSKLNQIEEEKQRMNWRKTFLNLRKENYQVVLRLMV